ncbi:MAG: DUF2076 family protein [Pseudomonadota bacterium]
MTSQEQQTLDDFLFRLAAVNGVAKDPQADALIQQRLAHQPDAAYLLVQRSLLLEQALDNARQQIEQLQQQAAQRSDPGGASFLNAGLEPGFGRAPAAPGVGVYNTTAPSAQLQPPRVEPTWRDRLFGGGAAAPAAAPAAAAGPSFLGTAASAAAGVAGGMFLFNGLENLLGGHHGANGNSLFGGGNNNVNGLLGPGMAPGQTVVEEVTNNNFYDNGNGGGGDRDGRDTRRDDYRQPVADDSSWQASDDGDSGGDMFGTDDDQFA